jgi:hypothetical protein
MTNTAKLLGQMRREPANVRFLDLKKYVSFTLADPGNRVVVTPFLRLLGLAIRVSIFRTAKVKPSPTKSSR